MPTSSAPPPPFLDDPAHPKPIDKENAMLESHDLFHEFPEHQETIRRLMLCNEDFVKMMRDYDDVDHKIVRIEQRVEAASDLYFEELKKLRVNLKDKLYKMILAAEH
jgi:uncharacterized protein YdcH (DUF465 family)